MYNKDKSEVLKYHREKIAKLMATTMVDDDTSFDMIDEAAVHLIEHFDPDEKHYYQKHDHVLLIGKSFFGRDIENCDKAVNASVLFMHGDMHALSHTLADMMVENPHLFVIIEHALQVYAKAKFEKGNGN
jgi:hypothetical protein